ncbi:hypothetical protein [Archaeoglobus profundus]|uniref:Uncharacterized protein n=1 Tax=Archaeoglobus profundus (strain DSM 5631 / JCM 9629 / NBRC 100127 / Av18) TaxID=572546 RepID=D2RF23_ARCPA|nr:hypothetical protein [Archaeoglobus profundus]ADB58717.1 hypothetical protein Arcpr_1671 [Archaeoglobus profundus DSM 5631]
MSKVKGEEVRLLVIGDGYIKEKKGIKLKESVIITEDGKGYLRTPKMGTSLELFLHAHLERGDEDISLNDLYQRYFEFCQAYDLEILNFDKFVRGLSRYVPIEEVVEKDEEGKSVVKLVAKGVSLTNKTIMIENGADRYFYIKKGLFKRKQIPVYVVVEGVPKTLSFSEVRGIAIDGGGSLRVIDDVGMGQLLTETLLMGATIGTQKIFKDIKFLVLIAVVFSMLAMIFGIYDMIYMNNLVKAVHSLQGQVNSLVNALKGVIT